MEGRSSDDDKCQKKKINLFDKYNDSEDCRDMRTKMKDFVRTYKGVLGTEIYVGSVLGRICDILAFKGYIVFLPKYLENHFGIPQFKVHRYMAIFGVFGFALGTVIGGFATRRFRMSGRTAALFVLIVSTINMGLFFSKSFIACESVVNSVGFNEKHGGYNFSRECNADCSCEGAALYPVCDKSGYVYFSPCHAGCKEYEVNRDDNTDVGFHSCECSSDGVVRKSLCTDTCRIPTIIFFFTVCLGSLFAGMGVVPGMLILLRSVPPNARSQSLGLQGFLVSLFGSLPSPILWGLVVDSACRVWDVSCTGGSGNCSVYDPHALRKRMHFTYAAVRLVSMLTDIYVWYHAKDLNILEEEKSDNGDLEVIEDVVRSNSVRLASLPVETH